MTPSMLALVPLIVLGVVLLFPFMGCVGEDPYIQGREDERKEQEEKRAEEKKIEQQDKEAEEQAALYQSVVNAEPFLVSYWRLSEGEVGDLTARDSAPDLPRDGQYKNAAGGGVSRNVDGALTVNQPADRSAEFDGAQGYVEIGHDGLLNPQQEFAIELWCRPEPGALTAQPQVLVGSYMVDATGAVNRGFVVDVLSDAAGPRVRGRVGNGTGFTEISASMEGGYEHDGWRHIVVSYSVATKVLQLFVNADNGAADASLPAAPPAPQTPVFYVENNTNPFRIGAGITEAPPSPAAAHFFKGRIDEVALYRAPLDGSRVKLHFQRATALNS